MAEIVVTEAAVEKAASEFYGAAYGSVGDAGNRVLHDSAREVLEATVPLLQVQVDREALTEVLAAHRIECTGPGEVTCRDCRDKGWMSWSAFHGHIADRVLALLSPEETKPEPVGVNTTRPVGRRSVPSIHHAEDCPMRVGLVTTGCFCGREGERSALSTSGEVKPT